MTIDDFSKLLLVGSISFGIIGISIQIIRLLGSVNESARLIPDLVKSVNKLIERMTDDYKTASDNVLKLTGSAGRIATDVVDPIITIGGFLANFAAAYVKKLTGVDPTEK